MKPRFRHSHLFFVALLLAIQGTAEPLKTCTEIAAQIARSAEHITYSTFNTQRDFNEYVDAFGADFVNELAKKRTERTHWIDLGAGSAHAARDIFAGMTLIDPRWIKATAIGFERPGDISFEAEIARAQEKHGPDGFKYLSGKYFHEITSTEIDRAHLITDFYGVLSYTTDLSRDLEKALERLKPGGVLMFMYSDSSFKLREADETTLPLKRYLNGIKGVSSVTVEPRGQIQMAKLVRTQAVLEVPPLALIDFSAEKPPKRSFQLK